MTRLLFSLLTTMLLLVGGCGRCAPPTVDEGDIEELVAARASLKRAMLDRDVETIKRIYTEGYGLVTRTGALRSRTERIGMIESGQLRYLRIGEEAEVSFETYGNVAVVRGVVESSETIFDRQQRNPGARRFTEIWVLENGEWKEAGRQSTAITEPKPSSRFVGTWSLERIEGRDDSGAWTSLEDRFGAEPAGYLMYDSSGHMSVQIMRKDRPRLTVEDRREIPPKEASEALLGYTAYFGTYSVDSEEQSVTHHRIGHIVPNQATVDGKRFYHFSGDVLTLTVPGQGVRLVWRRLS